jgi:hypothetical protein
VGFTQQRRRVASVIRKEEMMEPLLHACPAFEPAWKAFLNEWSTEEEKPIYLALGELARHLVSMLVAKDLAGLQRVFEVVERWLLEGDAYVREAATVGLLEDLQNDTFHTTTSPADFEPVLLPKSAEQWRQVRRFWNTGEPIGD